MLWLYILAALLIGATIHSVVASRAGRTGRSVELFLVYLLAGYYGVAMALAGVVQLLNPEAIARLKGWPSSPPTQTLYAFALFGLAASAVLWHPPLVAGKIVAPAISGIRVVLGGAYVHGSEMLSHAGRSMWRRMAPTWSWTSASP